MRRVFEDGSYADRSFRTESDRLGLDGRDRAFAMRLSYGAVQRRSTLDYLIERFTKRDIDQLDPPVVAALRIGIYQIAYMDRVPDHASVGESVELVKAARSRGDGLVNATLRRATREARTILDALPETTAAEAALRYSHPVWIAELWWDTLGADATRALMARDNEPAESAARANALRMRPQALLEELPIPAHVDSLLPDAIVFDEPFDVHGSEPFERGELMPQSRASALVAHALDPQPGERVLDLCAAPGAKTTHIAALMRDEGQVVAVEQNPERARSIEQNCARLGVECARVEVADATAINFEDEFDRVLVDPPCSDLGTLQSRPDVRWRKFPDTIDGLTAIQRQILEAGSRALKPGGTLVYSTCTISPAENETQIASYLEARADLHAIDLSTRFPAFGLANNPQLLQTLPSRDATDGFFVAALRKEP